MGGNDDRYPYSNFTTSYFQLLQFYGNAFGINKLSMNLNISFLLYFTVQEYVSRRCLGQNSVINICSVIALCLPVVSKLSRYKLVCYK